MRKYNIIEDIAFDMHSNEKLMPDKSDVVSDDEIIKRLQQIENLEQTDRDGRTLLINAAFYGRKSAIEYLLKRQANINSKDKMGFTALHAAVQERNLDIITFLLENGADIHARDAYGNPPIMRTNLATPKEVFKILLKYGADPKEKNNYGISAIDVYQAYPDVLCILCDEDVKVSN